MYAPVSHNREVVINFLSVLQGVMKVSLFELKKHTKMAGKKKLQHGNSPDARLELEMEWSSYLGSDDQGE